MAEATAKAAYSSFVLAAARAQLPVGFLRKVRDSNYTYSFGSSSYVRLTYNRMVLTQSTLAAGATLSPPPPLESPELGTLYHQSTHAWLDVMKDDPGVAKLIEEGKKYYKEAPLQGGKKVDDPERVLHEAMGTYVGHRIAGYWRVLETLTYLEAALQKNGADRGFILERARAARADYRRAMGERVFGYQQPPGLFGFYSNDQVYTTKMISDEAKTFCDRVLLENKISDQFERQPALMELWSKLQQQLPELR